MMKGKKGQEMEFDDSRVVASRNQKKSQKKNHTKGGKNLRQMIGITKQD